MATATLEYRGIKKQVTEYGYVIATKCSSNCKMSIIEGAGGLGLVPSEKAKKAFDELLATLTPVVLVHVVHESLRDWFLKNYETYYCNAVPIGYGYGGLASNQYHILIKNTLQPNTTYLR